MLFGLKVISCRSLRTVKEDLENEKVAEKYGESSSLNHDSVTANNSGNVVSRTLSIPVNMLMAGEIKKLIHIEDMHRPSYLIHTRMPPIGNHELHS